MSHRLEKPWLSHWPKGVPQSVEYPEISIGEMLRASALKAPKNPALYFQSNQLTYGDVDALVDRFAEALQDLGVRKGDRVALYLPNIPQFIIAYYGVLRIGAVVVAVSSLYKERELGHILDDSGAKIIVVWDRLYSSVQSVKERTGLDQIIATNVENYSLGKTSTSSTKNQKFDPDTYDMGSLMMGKRGNPRGTEIKPKEDIALLQYTGGTTGTPKGAMLTHYNLIVNAVQFATWLQMQPGLDVHLSVLPFYHIYGMTTSMNSPIYTRSPMILAADPRDLQAILEAAEKHRPTIFCGVPTTYITIINQPDIQKYDLRSIKVCISGASSLPGQVQKRFEELTGGRLVEGYGLTETSPVTHMNPLDDRSKNRIGSIGIPISDTEAKIVDLETGMSSLAAGEVGELVVRGPQVMLGYWNNPAETNMVLRDGWLYTGDLATMDRDGYFHLVDRKKDVINVSGFKVWPREVEDILYEHPVVKEAAVVGVPDSESGEAVKAFIVLKEDNQEKTSPEEIMDFCRERIASYKAPKIVDFRDELPKTPVGKILRRELRPRKSVPEAGLR
jgi:long-chain acyl-CoA synthetase